MFLSSCHRSAPWSYPWKTFPRSASASFGLCRSDPFMKYRIGERRQQKFNNEENKQRNACAGASLRGVCNSCEVGKFSWMKIIFPRDFPMQRVPICTRINFPNPLVESLANSHTYPPRTLTWHGDMWDMENSRMQKIMSENFALFSLSLPLFSHEYPLQCVCRSTRQSLSPSDFIHAFAFFPLESFDAAPKDRPRQFMYERAARHRSGWVRVEKSTAIFHCAMRFFFASFLACRVCWVFSYGTIVHGLWMRGGEDENVQFVFIFIIHRHRVWCQWAKRGSEACWADSCEHKKIIDVVFGSSDVDFHRVPEQWVKCGAFSLSYKKTSGSSSRTASELSSTIDSFGLTMFSR